jgi:hypothetical protein
MGKHSLHFLATNWMWVESNSLPGIQQKIVLVLAPIFFSQKPKKNFAGDDSKKKVFKTLIFFFFC